MTKPSRYTAKRGRNICARYAGGETLETISGDSSMPELHTMAGWLSEEADFRECSARARELRADVLFDQILAIADGQDGCSDAGAGETAQRARLRVEARKWIVARLSPRKYGEKPNASGDDADRPMVIHVITGVPRAGDDA